MARPDPVPAGCSSSAIRSKSITGSARDIECLFSSKPPSVFVPRRSSPQLSGRPRRWSVDQSCRRPAHSAAPKEQPPRLTPPGGAARRAPGQHVYPLQQATSPRGERLSADDLRRSKSATLPQSSSIVLDGWTVGDEPRDASSRPHRALAARTHCRPRARVRQAGIRVPRRQRFSCVPDTKYATSSWRRAIDTPPTNSRSWHSALRGFGVPTRPLGSGNPRRRWNHQDHPLRRPASVVTVSPNCRLAKMARLIAPSELLRPSHARRLFLDLGPWAPAHAIVAPPALRVRSGHSLSEAGSRSCALISMGLPP